MFNTIDLRIPVRVKAVWLNMLFHLYSLAGQVKTSRHQDTKSAAFSKAAVVQMLNI
jgi:hypothetical protein